MNFRTIQDLNNVINKNLHLIPDDVDLIVGIPRSGLLVANIVALYLNLPLTDLDNLLEGKMYSCGISKKTDTWIKNIEDARKILIIDDSCNTGYSFNNVSQKIENTVLKNKCIYLSAYVTEKSKDIVNMYFEICERPRMFEWNYLHNCLLNSCFMDIDGVLCLDPTGDENDDGEKYIQFLRNAPLRAKTTQRVHTLITCRLEKYRKDTEYWLNKHGIEYDNLIMMNFKTREERMKANCYGKFKAEAYKNTLDAELFIESSKRQAVEIAQITGKDVFCVEDQQIYKYDIDTNEQEGKKTENMIHEDLSEDSRIEQGQSVLNKIYKKCVSVIPTPIKQYIKRILKK